MTTENKQIEFAEWLGRNKWNWCPYTNKWTHWEDDWVEAKDGNGHVKGLIHYTTQEALDRFNNPAIKVA